MLACRIIGLQILAHADIPADGYFKLRPGPRAKMKGVPPGTLGIDPDIAWDSDGSCYLTWVGFGPGENESGIVQARLDPDAGRLLESPRKVWQGTGLAYPEGPHLYEAGGCWYLVLAEGGTERGHAVSVSRGSSPAGPFEPHPNNPILSHRSMAAPVQSVGHADLVETVDGDWAAVYLGVRPRGVVPGFHVLGRETYVAGISWDQGWPRFDEDRYQVFNNWVNRKGGDRHE